MSFFASKSIAVHLLRGIVGAGALYALIVLLKSNIWWAWMLLPLAFFLFRGCPMCWFVGLLETLALRIHSVAETSETSSFDDDCCAMKISHTLRETHSLRQLSTT